jgi:hypothetical protein
MGRTEVVRVLLRHPSVDPVRAGALDEAVRYHHLETVRLLLKDPRVTPSYLVLHEAATKGNINILKQLLLHPRAQDHTRIFDKARQGVFKPPINTLLPTYNKEVDPTPANRSRKANMLQNVVEYGLLPPDKESGFPGGPVFQGMRNNYENAKRTRKMRSKANA